MGQSFLSMSHTSLKALSNTIMTCLHWQKSGPGKLKIITDGAERFEDDTTVSISRWCLLDMSGNITIGKYSVISSGTRVYTHDHRTVGTTPLLLQEESDPEGFTTIIDKVICDDVWIFANAIVLGSCNFIATGVVIGAGAVVTKPITEEYSIWAGVPARRIGSRIEEVQ
jgi:putative colanic acid biosynthesis acetyltransferase WcaF